MAGMKQISRMNPIKLAELQNEGLDSLAAHRDSFNYYSPEQERWVVEETVEAPLEGESYYLDYRDGSVWTHSLQLRRFANEELPPQLERRLDAKGRTYYVNFEKCETSWLDPVILAEFRSQGLDALAAPRTGPAYLARPRIGGY